MVSQPCHHDHHDLLHVPHQRRVQGGDGGRGGGELILDRWPKKRDNRHHHLHHKESMTHDSLSGGGGDVWESSKVNQRDGGGKSCREGGPAEVR